MADETVIVRAARTLFLDQCLPGDRGTLERYGETAAVAAIVPLLTVMLDLKSILYTAESNASGNLEWDYVGPRVAAYRAALVSAGVAA